MWSPLLHQWWSFHAATAVVFVAGFTTIRAGLRQFIKPSLSLPGVAVGAVGGLVASAAVARRMHRTLRGERRRAYRDAALAYVQGQELFAITIGRAVRLVQEVELIARGYGISSRLAPITRLELASRVRLCMPLRECIAHTLYVNLKQSRAATRRLLHEFPMAASVDYPGSFICNSRLADLGVCDAVDREAVSQATNDMSLAYLKHMFDIANQQRSEFLRRLSLSFSPLCQRSPNNVSPPPSSRQHSTAWVTDGTYEVPSRLLGNWDQVLADAGQFTTWAVGLLEREMTFRMAETQVGGGRGKVARVRAPGDIQSIAAGPARDRNPNRDSSLLEGFCSLSTQVSTHAHATIATLHLCHDRLRALLVSISDASAALQTPTDMRQQHATALKGQLTSAASQLALAQESLVLCGDELARILTATVPEAVATADDNAAFVASQQIAPLMPEHAADVEAVVLADNGEFATGPTNFEAFTGARSDSEGELEGLTQEQQRVIRSERRARRRALRQQRQRDEERRVAQRRQADNLMNELKAVIQHH